MPELDIEANLRAQRSFDNGTWGCPRLEAENERLRAEIERLRAELEQLEKRLHKHQGRAIRAEEALRILDRERHAHGMRGCYFCGQIGLHKDTCPLVVLNEIAES